MNWLNAPSSTQYREAMQALLDVAHEKQIKNWLINSSHIGFVSADSVNWLYEHWLPQFLQMPIAKYACVAPKDLYYQMVLEDMFDYRQRKINFDFQFFSDMNLALEWIREEITLPSAQES